MPQSAVEFNVKIVKNVKKLSLSSGNANSALLAAWMSLQVATVALSYCHSSSQFALYCKTMY